MKILSKNVIKTYIIVAIIMFICIIEFLFNTTILKDEPYNAFNFWSYVRSVKIGEVFMFMTPIFVSLLATKDFFNNIRTGNFKKFIVKEGYKKYIIKNISESYIKAIILLPLISLMTFGIGVFLYGVDFSVSSDNHNLVTRFVSIMNPVTFVCLYTGAVAVFSLIITNISLILTRFLDKFYLVLVGTFVSFNGLNFITTIIFKSIIKNKSLIDINLYYLYTPRTMFQDSMIINIACGIVFLVATSILVFIVYRSKEKMVLNIE
ncbi:MAG: hypothetical protein RSC09_06515 [Clostridia bacterium]